MRRKRDADRDVNARYFWALKVARQLGRLRRVRNSRTECGGSAH
jgi:hypothetical protein